MSSSDHDAKAPTRDDEEFGGTTVVLFPWEHLPPFPTPRYRTQRNESLSGIAMVTVIAGVLVGLTHGIALGIGFDIETNPTAWWTIFSLIYGQALLAIIFLAALLLVDPGVVRRSAATCYPLPPLISKWLADGASPDDKPSELYFPSVKENCNDTYCTRCMVWRRDEGVTTKNKKKTKKGAATNATAIATMETTTTTTTIIETTTTETQIIVSTTQPTSEAVEVQPDSPPKNTTITTSTTQLEISAASGSIKYFHCNTCQRCVRHFDHHCSFFGRCIAGSLFRREGNLLFFWGIIGVGVTAYITCLASILAGLLNVYDTKWVLPFFFLGLLVVHSCNPFLQAALCSIRRFVCGCLRLGGDTE